MPSRFRISKTGVDPEFPWELYYPVGFDDLVECDAFATFEDAVKSYTEAQNRECPLCLKGAVVDTDWGWQCEACGSNDVAVDCTHPSQEQAHA